MNIRELRVEDRSDIQSILSKVGVFKPIEIECALELIGVYLNNPEQNDYYLSCLADENNKAVGYVCYGQTPLTDGVYDLYWIAVDPACQNKGVGGILLGYVEQEVKQNGGRMILVETSSLSSYEQARLFYKKHRYLSIAVIPDFYSLGDDKIIFMKRFAV